MCLCQAYYPSLKTIKSVSTKIIVFAVTTLKFLIFTFKDLHDTVPVDCTPTKYLCTISFTAHQNHFTTLSLSLMTYFLRLLLYCLQRHASSELVQKPHSYLSLNPNSTAIPIQNYPNDKWLGREAYVDGSVYFSCVSLKSNRSQDRDASID